MAVEYTSKQLTAAAIAAETEYGVLPTGGYNYLTVQSLSPSGETKTEMADEVTGRGEKSDAITVFRAGKLSVKQNLRALGGYDLLAAVLYSGWTGNATVTGSSNINVVASGTHQDGTTGPQLTAPTNTFNTLKTYGGAASNGIEGLLLKITGSAQAANNRRRRAKSVWNNGSVDCIDLFKGYHTGSAGLHGEPMVATTNESLSISTGSVLRNRKPSPDTNYSKGVVWQHANGNFGFVRGWVPGSWKMALKGQSKIQVDVDGLAAAKGDNLPDDPTGDWGPPSTPTLSRMMTGDGLFLASLIPYDGLDGPINLSGAFINSLDLSADAKNSGVDDVAGTQARVGIVAGEFMADLSIGYVVGKDDAGTISRLTRLGESTTAQRAIVEWCLRDTQGNEFCFGALGVEFEQVEQTAAESGDGVITGTLKGTCLPFSDTSRTFVAQRFLV